MKKLPFFMLPIWKHSFWTEALVFPVRSNDNDESDNYHRLFLEEGIEKRNEKRKSRVYIAEVSVGV